MSNPLFSFNSTRGRNNLSIGSLAEIKFIIKSVVVPQSTSKFAALIKNANDSETFNTSLENKSIGTKIDSNNIHKGEMSTIEPSTNTNSDIININNVYIVSNNEVISGEDHFSESIHMDTSNDSYSKLKDCVTSSTPVKLSSVTNQSENRSETYKLNLHTPPEDTSFIDSDNESMEPDKCNTTIAVDFYNSTDTETLRNASIGASNAENNINIMTPEEFSFKKPQQSSLSRHKKMLKEPRVLKFFTNRRRKKSKLNNDHCDSDSSRSTSPMSRYNELGCSPLLVTENIKRIYKNMEWGDDFDFSYICEPSTSDLENDDANMDDNAELDSLNVSTYDFQPACVPTFRITAPDDLSRNSITKKASVQVLRRSLSNPNSLLDLLNKSADMCYETFVEAAVRLEGTSHCASVRNLDTLSVSF